MDEWQMWILTVTVAKFNRAVSVQSAKAGIFIVGLFAQRFKPTLSA